MSKESARGQYSIQLASKISGVGIHTIRAWEKRYQAITPQRSENGRREYSDDDIDKLTLLSELCILGHSIGKIATLSRTELRLLLEKLGRKANAINSNISQDHHALKGPVNIQESLKSLYLALEYYKLDVISHELNKLKLILNPRDLALEIISPLLVKVGRAISEERLNIAQEHALSALLKFHIGHLLYRNPTSKSPKRTRALISCPEGDYHEFGILQAALLCSYYNIPYVYLGPNLPLKSLVDASTSLDVNTLIIGSAIAPDGKGPQFVNHYISALSKKLPDCKILVGGNSHLDGHKINSYINGTFFDHMMDLDRYLRSL